MHIAVAAFFVSSASAISDTIVDYSKNTLDKSILF